MRIRQLENNIVFMRRQHVELLNALHVEVETLKRKNSELQFRLISDKELKQEVNVEVVRDLEANVASLKAELEEAKARNAFLTELLEEQKRQSASNSSTVVTSAVPRGENALKAENENLRRQLEEARANLDQSVTLRYRGCNHPNRLKKGISGSTSRAESLERFPPLRKQNFSPVRNRHRSP